MEFLDGTTLKHRIAERPLEIDILVSLGIEIVDALDAAHTAGIVHRDIKPANIFVTRHGHAKILDFGLAKLNPLGASPEEDAATVGSTVTIDDQITRAGSVMGTVSYMSPEQVRAEPLDARTDLFSLGVVLYEMATGKLPFRGENAAMIFDSILNRDPVPVSSLNPDLPAELECIICKCLEKDRDLRHQRAAEIRADLERLKHSSESPDVAQSRPNTSLGVRRKTTFTVAAIVTAFAVAGYFYSREKPKLTDKDTIVLADFKNTTGDPVFDGTLRRGLAVELGQSPFLNLISDQRIQHTFRLMGRPPDTPLTPELGREVCERTGSAAVLEGSIAPIGSQIVLGLNARNCTNGDVLDDEQVQVARKEEVLSALTQMASRFRVRVGESLITVKKHAMPLAEAATPSLDALKAFSTGWKVLMASHSAALPFFQRAIEIDPDFATAHAWLARMYGGLGESVLSRESSRKAWQLRHRASDQERFFIDFSYHRQVTGDLEKARQTCELWAQTYPRDMQPHAFLAGSVSTAFGKFEKATEEGKRAIELDPDHPYAYANLAASYIYRERLEEARITLQRAAERKLDINDFLLLRYQIAFLRNDKAELEKLTALAQREFGSDDWICNQLASVMSYSGHLQLARRMSRRAIDLARQAGHPESAAQHEAAAAAREILFGNAPEARRIAGSASDLTSGRDAEYGAAVALALSGNSLQAQALAEDLEKRFPQDTLVNFSYLPVLRALLALNHRQPSKAVELLQSAAAIEVGDHAGSSVGFVGTFYPIYVRGLAYLAEHRGAEAAAEFQRILDHPGIVLAEPIGAVARLQLSRAFVLAGAKSKARTSYQDFLTLWNNADPDIPILKQAQAEYARLR
jgi:Tfp pilus assembly protein PilF